MTTPTPAQLLATFFESLPFDVDAFQRDALASVASGRSVVVTAPTGAGKTVIADGAVALAIGRGQRAFYTTPIKALSNQKFNDLRSVYGDEDVGLLTGDNVINGDAPVVVMTTEVLRNMIYEGSTALDRLGVAILDEVHYLADRHRGSVWEEVIIHLAHDVPVVCLSATIANAREFTDWVTARRGPTDLVVEEHRPVPLSSMYAWNDRHQGNETQMLPVFGRNGRPNGQITKALQRARGRRRRFVTPRRLDIVTELGNRNLLPAIYFVFSRKGCDDASRQLAHAHLGLTDRDERDAIRRIAERHTAHLSADDLGVLGYDTWLDTLLEGAAAHHAGMVPAFKETVEELFLAGLVKVVVATETLALGINMPARTVVLESLSKFNGESHELLQASDFTQLTGRAGRRGIDDSGTAVVLHSSYVPFDRVSSIAAAGANALRSSFSPTYNMTVNLIARYREAEAHELLAASFANFSDEQRHRQLESNLEDRRRDVATFRRAAACDKGDLWEVLGASEEPVAAAPRTELLAAGSVLSFSKRNFVLLSRSWGGGSPHLHLTDEHGVLTRVRAKELPKGTVYLGHISLPTPVRSADPSFRKEAGSLLSRFVPEGEGSALFEGSHESPVLRCPDLDDHLQWAERAKRAERDVRRLERRVERRVEHDVVSDFDRLHRVLDELGYTDGWALLERGDALRRLYNELDLLLAECLADGSFLSLDAAEFAATMSIFTFEARGGEVSQMPVARYAEPIIDVIAGHWETVIDLEERHGIERTRAPDPGLIDTLHGWAKGMELDELFEAEDIRAGDFVRSCRQVLDLLRQVRDGYPQYRSVASRAIGLVDRGIVEVTV